MTGQGFQFSPMGIVPLPEGEGEALDENSFAPAVAPPKGAALDYDLSGTRPVSAVLPRGASLQVGDTALHSAPLLKPRDVVKLARTRLREIKQQLRQHEKLKREKVQLERLIAAANGKQLAPVRAIDSARRSAG